MGALDPPRHGSVRHHLYGLQDRLLIPGPRSGFVKMGKVRSPDRENEAGILGIAVKLLLRYGWPGEGGLRHCSSVPRTVARKGGPAGTAAAEPKSLKIST